jgi:hypothetical protein
VSDMSGVGGGNEAAGATAEAGAGAGAETPDVAALISGLGEQFGSRLDALSSSLDERFAAFGEGGEEEGGEGGGEELAPVFSESDFDERGEVTLEAVGREIQRITDERVQQGLQGINAERAAERDAAMQERNDAALDALEERYPQLQDPEVQAAVVERAARVAQEIGADERTAGNAAFIQQAYLAYAAERAAEGEIPANALKEHNLERGGGAGPAAAASDDRAGNIVKSVTRSQFRLGRG